MDCGRAVDTDLLAEYDEVGIDLGFRPAKYRVSRPAAGGKKDENDTVNVYPSGKLVCLGAKSVERAQTNMRMVLRRLGVAAAAVGASLDGGKAAAAVKYVVMSGCIFGGYDVYKAIPMLKERYEVTLDSEVFSGYFVRSKSDDGESGNGSGDSGRGKNGSDSGRGKNGSDSGRSSGGVSIQVFTPDVVGGGSGSVGGGGAVDAGTDGDVGGDANGSGGRTPLLCRGPTVHEIRTVVDDVYRTIVEANENADRVDDGDAGRGGRRQDATTPAAAA